MTTQLMCVAGAWRLSFLAASSAISHSMGNAYRKVFQTLCSTDIFDFFLLPHQHSTVLFFEIKRFERLNVSHVLHDLYCAVGFSLAVSVVI